MGQMSLLEASVAILLLINTIGATVIPLQKFHTNSERYSESSEARDGGNEYRLPLTVTPDMYNITLTLTPEFGENANFTGEVEILVTAIEDGKNISLHYDDITIVDREVTDMVDTVLELDEDDYDQTTNIYTLTLRNNQTFILGDQYKIKINYTGHLLDDMAGFYRSSYTAENGDKR
jgi:aminopeptidase 2